MSKEEDLIVGYHEKGLELKRQGKYEDSIRMYEKVMDSGYYVPETCKALAKVYFIVGRYKDAITLYSNSFVREYKMWMNDPQYQPEFATSVDHLAYAYLAAQGELSRADRDFYLVGIDPANREKHQQDVRRNGIPESELQKNRDRMKVVGMQYCDSLCDYVKLPRLSQYFHS